jgi:hypothetical protein
MFYPVQTHANLATLDLYQNGSPLYNVLSR